MVPGSDVFHGVSRKPGQLLEYFGLTPAYGALYRGGPNTSVTNGGNKMENSNFIKVCARRCSEESWT